ncbi:Na+/H+ antiporter NhaA [Novosphingobium sp.]|uniref:Na+/H+ antiporter NhaA n=1 Tax=Novosphingobium sp. TaxID=1874826 RepID=UPI00180D653A
MPPGDAWNSLATWFMRMDRHYANELARRFIKLMGGEAGSGILLIIMAVLAMSAANSPLSDGYHALFHHELPWTPISRLTSVHAWINDALMALFFFVVGLEIKREVLGGELSSPEKRRLPVLAAAAGMAMPALIYLITAGTQQPEQRGWAIPAATDIAFAVGVLGLLGRRVPSSLRLFLLTVAIVDDLGAVIIIALFYTAQIELGWALAAIGLFAALLAVNRARIQFISLYLALGLGLWFCVLNSGIHATIAGVLFAFTIPLRTQHGDSMLLRLEHALAPWIGYLVVPVFGFANAGVALAGIGMAGLFAPVPLGIGLGLFIGKQAGVFAAIYLADRLGIAPRPAGASWLQLWGTAVLCGIGFTMSLFIGALAFPSTPLLVEEAKLGVLAGSLASSLLGFVILRFAKAPSA